MSSAALHHGGITPSKVQAYAGRTLDLLQTIEKTIDVLSENSELLRLSTAGVHNHLDKVRSSEIHEKLDPEGRVCQLLMTCLEIVARVHSVATRKRDAAAQDSRLHDDDGVVDAYEAFLVALNDHHDALHEFVDWVQTHDSLLDEPSGGTYANVDDLFKAMGITTK